MSRRWLLPALPLVFLAVVLVAPVLRLLVEGLAPGAADAEPLLTVAKLHVDAELQSLLRLAKRLNLQQQEQTLLIVLMR